MRLFIIGPASSQIQTAAKIARDKGADVAFAPEPAIAFDALRSGKGADLLLVETGFDVGALVSQLQSERFHIPVVAFGTVNDTKAAVRAVKAGAKEYLPLPPDAEMIEAILAAVAQDSHQMIGQDPVFLGVVRLAEQVAPSDASVLITGESGTGKEIMARFIHRKSRRVKGPFISLNCAAIPENLLESELFGHEKGAFSGAVARRIGKFEESHGGTLFLDEISEMDLRLQAKLLRAIQEREIQRLGSNKNIKVDIRLLATSNRDLEKEVAAGHFRQDLYFRLNVINIALPALRDHPGDILPLAQFFAAKYAELNAMPVKRIASEAEKTLRSHQWPGNIRELENAIYRATLIAPGAEITSESLFPPGMNTRPAATPAQNIDADSGSPDSGSTDSSSPVGRTVAEVERDLILDTLSHTLGNRTHAATILGISIRTLRNKLHQYAQEGAAIPEGEGSSA